MKFKTIFDITHVGYSWSFLAPGLVPIFMGMLLIAAFKKTPGLTIRATGYKAKLSSASGWIWLIFGLFWTVMAFSSTYRQYVQGISSLHKRTCSVVEGTVKDFVSTPQGVESFTVKGQRFLYSDAIVTSGFHQTALHGAPIKAGLNVRVAYLGNLILRLEVAE